MSIKPIGPEQARALKITTLPDEVMLAVNELLTERYTDPCFITLKQKEVVERIRDKFREKGVFLSNEVIFSKGWMDFESIYRDAGWKVEYDKPGFNESYDAFFIFSKPK